MTKPSPFKVERQRAEKHGRWAETLAALYLRAQFFSIAAQRVKSPVGEVDLIARRGKLVVFVEVKARARQADLATALESVNTRRIVRAAQHFLSRHPELAGYDMRFDVIFLAPWTWPRHVKDAFSAD